jgi:hypothetical protein
LDVQVYNITLHFGFDFSVFQMDLETSLMFRFLLGFLQKKEHFIEYLVQALWFERNRCQNTIFSLKSDFKA